MPMIPCAELDVSYVLCDPANSNAYVYVVSDLVEGGAAYYNGDGTVWAGDPATLVECQAVLVATTDGNVLGVTQSGDADHIVDITLLSTDPNNLVVTGTDGGVFLDCLTVEACLPELVVTTNGTALGVTHDATDDHIVDITVVSGDTGNDIVVGSDGGAFLNICDGLSALIVTNDVPNDGVTGEMIVGIDENGDCVLFDPPEGCCIVSTTLCDPASGEAVIVAIDISSGTSSYYIDNGTVWAGDPSTLVSCTGYVDCGGAAIAPGSRLITADDLITAGAGLSIAWVDSGDGCTPAAPPWPNLHYVTIRPDGAKFTWDGAAWTLECAPSDYYQQVVEAVARVNGADIDPLVGQVISSVELVVENTDPCRVLCFRADYRGGQPAVGGNTGQVNVWQLNYASTGGNWTGSPSIIWDNRGYDGSYEGHAYATVNEFRALQCLNPGESVTLRKEITFAPLQYTSHASNTLLIGNVVLSAFGRYEYC